MMLGFLADMGLFDALMGQAAEALSEFGKDANPRLLDEVSRLVGGTSAGDGTDLISLLAKFRSNGLESAVESWIGVGQNRKISASQLQSILGNEQVAAIARRLGMSSADASSALAKLLPEIVDKLTPEGQLPSDDALKQAASLLSTMANRP